jgi:hypothetical protein
VAQLRRKPFSLTGTSSTTFVESSNQDDNYHIDIEQSGEASIVGANSNGNPDNANSDTSTSMGSFEACKREAAALERLLEDKVSRYQQVRAAQQE